VPILEAMLAYAKQSPARSWAAIWTKCGLASLARAWQTCHWTAASVYWLTLSARPWLGDPPEPSGRHA
jgi:hypothetical protein